MHPGGIGLGDDPVVLIPGADRAERIEVAAVGKIAAPMDLDILPGGLDTGIGCAELGREFETAPDGGGVGFELNM
ncbi:MAG: hypothetical protein HC822_17610 [Oscillochloris sp.]|nr:hypothetical protein [Oscillochloris sp.]